MKTTNILYWIFTGLFSALVILSSIGNITSSPEAVEVMKQLGYPAYLLPFLGIAKTAGAVVILIPGLKRLKEWAYAGLFFDFSGAMYSGIMIGNPPIYLLIFLLFFGLLFLSYYFYHKKLRLRTSLSA